MQKTSRIVVTLSVLVLASTLALAQQSQLMHNCRPLAPTATGRLINAAEGLFQRYPADQLCGAVTLSSFNVVLQDQLKQTPETVTFLVRKNNTAGPATGSPDISATGVLATLTVAALSFGTGTGVAAVRWTVNANMPLPASGTGVPADDIYVGVELPVTTGTNPAWPTDGCSMWFNDSTAPDAGEQFRASFVGYTGVAGTMGLGWGSNIAGAVALLPTLNRSWQVAVRLAQDVLQPFADNPTVFTGGTTAGLNPNFGYAGIAPDVASPRNDGLGLRLRSMAPVGSVVTLGYDFSSVGPQNLGVNGNLCLNLGTAILYPVNFTTTAPNTTGLVLPAHNSEVILGPLTGLQSLAGLGNVYAQMGTFDSTAVGGIRISTLCRFNL